MLRYTPKYLKEANQALLAQDIRTARQRLEACDLCPRQCKVNRLAGQTGICRTGPAARVSSWGPHFGEEAPLVGTGGSGTIFFSGCNLMCSFCQNYGISHNERGFDTTPEQLAGIMLDLQHQGCGNINFVTPSHVVPQILEALPLAAEQGLRIPLVYNSSGYDRVDALRLLEAAFDIFLPDFKFWDPEPAKRFCQAPDYPETARKAIQEMFRQAGNLRTDTLGKAISGVIIRHLVMPLGLAGTEQIMAFLKELVSPGIHVNIMSQYRPMGETGSIPDLSRPVTRREYHDALEAAKRLNMVIMD
ncbi:MAG: radical SAM protein [Pseudomonadota bacterium]